MSTKSVRKVFNYNKFHVSSLIDILIHRLVMFLLHDDWNLMHCRRDRSSVDGVAVVGCITNVEYAVNVDELRGRLRAAEHFVCTDSCKIFLGTC